MEFKRLFISSTATLILMIFAVGCGGGPKSTAEPAALETAPGVEHSATISPTIMSTSTTASQPTSTVVVESIPTANPVPTATGTPVPTAEPKRTAAYLIGDGRVGSSPQNGWIFSCATQFRDGADHTGEWVKDGYWYPAQKIAVLGENVWANTIFTVEVKDGARLVTGNGLPVGHPTGNFPIARNDPAYKFDPNPNAISEQSVEFSLPLHPNLAATPSCIPMGMVGVATNGVAFFNGLDAAGRDAVAHEVQDSCSGHPERDGQYHYHGPGSCHTDAQTKTHSLAGFALDGFGIFGVFDDQGVELTNADLDECHGHSHEIKLEGELTESFHYHLTNEYPYTLGCFMGSDVMRMQLAPPSQQGQALEPPPRR